MASSAGRGLWNSEYASSMSHATPPQNKQNIKTTKKKATFPPDLSSPKESRVSRLGKAHLHLAPLEDSLPVHPMLPVHRYARG